MADLLLYDRPGLPLALRVARDDQQNFLIRSKTLPFIRPSTPVGEATYANTDPSVAGIYASDDFSEGMGQKFQRPGGKGYWYASGIDCSHGIQRGPKVTTITATATAGGLMTGQFDFLGGTNLVTTSAVLHFSGGTPGTFAATYEAADLSGAATFFVLGDEASVESASGDAATDNIQSSDARIAQQFRSSGANLRQISKVVTKLIGATTNSAGDIRLQIYTDLNGEPGESLASARQLYEKVGTSAVEITFRFEDTAGLYLEPNAPYWLVMDMATATGTNYIGWRRSASDTYTRGASKTSSNGGNSWTAATGDYYFAIWARPATETIFVGRTNTSPFLTSTDNSTYTADSYRRATAFVVVGDRLVRDVPTGTAYPNSASNPGSSISWTDDGKNWSPPLLVGDPTDPIQGLYNLNGTLIVAKVSSLWAVDIAAADVETGADMQGIFAMNRYGTDGGSFSGKGGTVWRGAAYIPYANRLLAIEGSFDAGFVVHEGIGPESVLDAAPALGIAGVSAVVGDRFCLWAAVVNSANTGVELMKSYDPLNRVWHGSVASLPLGGNPPTKIGIWDIGQTYLYPPKLFFTEYGSTPRVYAINSSRTRNPADDALYLYETTGTGSLYFSVATGNFPNHQKAWISDSLTYSEQATSDSAQMLYDLFDGQGYRVFAQPWHHTDRQDYPNGLLSVLLGRQLVMTTTTSSTSSIIVAAALEFAVRRDEDLRAFTIVVPVRPSSALTS